MSYGYRFQPQLAVAKIAMAFYLLKRVNLVLVLTEIFTDQISLQISISSLSIYNIIFF